MDVSLPDTGPSPKARKKRIPKACSSCRQSKVKCDGQRPCLRCRGQKKTCTFTERPKDAHELRIESLANEVETLKARLGTPQSHVDVRPEGPSLDAIMNKNTQRVNNSMPPIQGREDASIYDPAQSMPSISPLQMPNPDPSSTFDRPQLGSGTDGSPTTTLIPDPRNQKRKRSHFEPGVALLPDFVTAGLLTLEQAKSYFDAFFQGCDRYVPVFDPHYDTLQGVRSRSGLLFSTICTVGCRVMSGTESHQYHLLNFHIKRMLNSVITSPTNASLEAVQALLVRACYVPERSLLVAIATRIALDLGLPEAYDRLCSSFISRGSETEQNRGFFEDGATLMRKTRTWMHLLVLGHILHVDAGDFPTFGFRGDVRRCRILLDSSHSTDLDLRLFSQVELNVLRAKLYDSLSNCANVDDEEILEMVRDARMDLEIWFNDWMRIVERCKEQLPQLSLNLRIQRCWAVAIAMCRAVRLSGVENVNAMSPTQKNVLLMAKDALKEHLIITIQEPRIYLQELRFAMDFVWAKCAFCYLLLLKLSMLLPDDDEQLGWDLVEQGGILLAELNKVAGGLADGARSSTSRLYLQLLQASIAKYRHALQGGGDIGEGVATGEVGTPHQQGTMPGISRTGGQNELESFVPEQFVFEWDFPGLTLFSSPTTEAVWLDEFLLGALNGGEDLYNAGWASLDMGG